MIYLKYSWISDTEYDQSGNSNSSCHIGAEILNLLFFYDFFIFFHVVSTKIGYCLSLSLLLVFKSLSLSWRLSNSLWDHMFYCSVVFVCFSKDFCDGEFVNAVCITLLS